jgi:hypothetical protein
MTIYPKLLEQLASCEHAIWCEQKRHYGCKCGPIFDPEAQVHDALRPFAELSAFERDGIVLWFEHLEVLPALCEAVDVALQHQELSAADLKVGIRVRWAAWCTTDQDVSSESQGQVLEWQVVNPSSGRLNWIKVRWGEGDVVVHAPNELEVIVDA